MKIRIIGLHNAFDGLVNMFPLVISRNQHITGGRAVSLTVPVTVSDHSDDQHVKQGEVAENQGIIDHQDHTADDEKQYPGVEEKF